MSSSILLEQNQSNQVLVKKQEEKEKQLEKQELDEERQTKGEKEDEEMTVTQKSGEGVVWTREEFIKQIERQVERNKLSARTEQHIQWLIQKPFYLFLQIVGQNYLPLYRLIKHKQHRSSFPRLRLHDKGHLNVASLHSFLLFIMLLFVNRYLSSFASGSAAGWVVLVVIILLAATFKHNHFMVNNTVLPLFFNYDNSHLLQNKPNHLNMSFQFNDDPDAQGNQPQLALSRDEQNTNNININNNNNNNNNMTEQISHEELQLQEGQEGLVEEDKEQKKGERKDYYLGKGEKLRKQKTTFEIEKDYIELYVKRENRELKEVEEKLEEMQVTAWGQAFTDGQLFGLFITVVSVIFFIYLVVDSLQTNDFSALIVTYIPLLLAEQLVSRPLFCLALAFYYYQLFLKSYNLHIIQLREDFIRKNMAYQSVMARRQHKIELLEVRLEEQRKREKEELKRLLKQYNKDQLQDINDQDLMGNGYKQGQLDAFDPHANYDSYDDEDEYSDDMDSPMAKKYGQSVSPSRPMFDPYQSNMLNKPFFNQEQSAQISSLLDKYNNSLTKSLSRTMDLNLGSFMMMNRYNPQFKIPHRAKLPQIKLENEEANQNLFHKIKTMTQNIKNIDDFEKNELQKEFIGVMNRRGPSQQNSEKKQGITLHPLPK